ncbi:hypothetical protein KCU67_g14576, partial [Aureobasidium melanogenum]
ATPTTTTSTVVESSATAIPPGTAPNGSSPGPVGGFSTGAKVGCALGAAVVVGLLIFWLRPKKRKNKTMVHQDFHENDAFKDKITPMVGTLETGGSKTD